MLNQIYAFKQRMSQEFLAGKRVPVTSLLVPSHQVVSEKTVDKDGYRSIIIALGQAKKMTTKKSLLGFLKSKELNFTPKRIKEIKPGQDETARGLLQIEKIVTPNSLITVSAKSKGKGFAGVVKRWGFRGGPRTHGQSDRQRTPGSIGRGTTPGRILPGKKMPGRMGGANIATRNLQVIAYDPATGILKVKGAVPGPTNAFVTIKVTKLA
ncbi:50S ribosomal protein L3 [Candidatus Collierbacteria bacterium RIFCSPLOWO2_01_FULL_50_23]|uniref:50S ribosomal protein L3 n=2 Tax=Candidatus Collieribacteriota TaxID=1752725 RepID=A0A1F5EUQ3_9BACT|nr:ribosomal protein L3 [uncultured bacterium]OGD71117.1 MAG: 50S ribosomal protein L3 [Candidatus Collierbacteria bacterium RIFCSPHIGHO2_02_FULL_49_10]OGD71668.1 MAG: 50S ribosomal protein L3 [Candidatus Collierbacteria bacterium RIFCSPHIGHO2_01_FULL_50_25]OGD73980.1 MAG: 50S ribosomal protein L3 [Candidatus Collierbacteria bacterium RIFCSPLOWO2_01_FULL_50_23]